MCTQHHHYYVFLKTSVTTTMIKPLAKAVTIILFRKPPACVSHPRARRALQTFPRTTRCGSQSLAGHSHLHLGLSATPARPVPCLWSLGLTWVLTRLERKPRVTSSCTAAAAPCPATARRNPGLMVTSAAAVASVARGWGTAGRRDDDGRRQCPRAGNLLDPGSKRRFQVGNTLPFQAVATDVPVLRAPASSHEAPPPESSVMVTPLRNAFWEL